jgi:hypothetical protein
LIAFAFLPTLSASASVTRVYEWHEPGGQPVLSDVAPPPNIGKYTIRDVRTPTLTKKENAAIARQLALDHAILVASAASPDDDIATALQQLARAREERTAARAPLPGERLHNAGGGSRLAPWYFTRQAQLDDAVSRAKAQLDAAYARRDASLA